MTSGSRKFSLDAADLKKIAVGAALAGSSAMVVYLHEHSQAIADLFAGSPVLYAVAVAAVPVALNALRKVVSGPAS